MTALPEGTRLADYTLSHVLGEGGFGVTYLAVDEKIGVQFAIKEYFPQAWANRDSGDSTSVTPNSASKGDYAWGLSRFIDEAKTLGRFRHPSIVRVNRVIEANGTAYMVLDYEEGRNFGAWLEELGRPPTQQELDAILQPLLDALALVHANGILHRDIAPDNIMIRRDGTPVLLDFGSARDAIGKQSKTISSIIKSGYSPVEQYTTDIEDQGPWTDIYALAATLYRAVTGTKPPESTRRITRDRLEPAAGKAPEGYRRAFLDAIDHALALNFQDRPDSIESWRRELFAGVQEAAAAPPAPAAAEVADAPPVRSSPGRADPLKSGAALSLARLASRRRLVAAAAALLIMAGAGLYLSGARTPAEKSLTTAQRQQPVPPRRAAEPSATQQKRQEEAERTRAEAARKAEEAARAQAARTAPGREFKDCDDCPTMVVIPAGSFLMGSPASEALRDADEGPQRRVTIARAFALGKFEVTRDEFEAFVRDTGHDAGNSCVTFENGSAAQRSGRSFRNPGYSQTGTHPAACISWNDALAYVRWLSRKTGKTYRLASEAEWEYAARAGSSTSYSFGSDPARLCRFGNGADQSVRALSGTANWTILGCNDGFATTAPVGRFSPNRFALHDMHGNLWEWVADCYNPTYAGAPVDGRVWTAGDCAQRIARGGSWNSSAKSLRAANRIRARADYRNRANGFRVLREL
ncbi:MAG: hypothetical protein Kow0032_29020 [Methyloligellaceae bacterium]